MGAHRGALCAPQLGSLETAQHGSSRLRARPAAVAAEKEAAVGCEWRGAQGGSSWLRVRPADVSGCSRSRSVFVCVHGFRSRKAGDMLRSRQQQQAACSSLAPRAAADCSAAAFPKVLAYTRCFCFAPVMLAVSLVAAFGVQTGVQ